MYMLFSGRDIFPRVWSCDASVVCKNRICIVQVNVCRCEKILFSFTTIKENLTSGMLDSVLRGKKPNSHSVSTKVYQGCWKNYLQPDRMLRGILLVTLCWALTGVKHCYFEKLGFSKIWPLMDKTLWPSPLYLFVLLHLFLRSWWRFLEIVWFSLYWNGLTIPGSSYARVQFVM